LKKRQTSFVGSKSFVYAKVFYFLQQFFWQPSKHLSFVKMPANIVQA
jgi:hypothetical protein